jgi:hypothetical protein
MTPVVARQLRGRGITVGRAPPDGLLALLEGWREQAVADASAGPLRNL